jgi:hypothetical protein
MFATAQPGAACKSWEVVEVKRSGFYNRSALARTVRNYFVDVSMLKLIMTWL